MDIFGVDWQTVFLPETPLLETLVRGTVIYLALFLLLRVVVKREAGSVSITDLLAVVLLADAVQNGMADDYRSITDGLILVGTIVFWSYALDWLGYHIPALEQWVHPPPLLLVEDGKLLRHNMKRELVTKDELMSELREQGIEELSKVKKMYMEGDGRFSVITTDGAQKKPQERNSV